RALTLVPRPVHAVDEQNVGPAVRVVVEKSTARSHRLGQQLAAEGPAVVTELKAGRSGDVGQREAGLLLRECVVRPRGGRECRAARPQTVATLQGSVTRPLLIA